MTNAFSWIKTTFFSAAIAMTQLSADETLSLDVVNYDQFMQGDEETLTVLKNALQHKGIVGVRGISNYTEKVKRFIATARDFSLLPEEVKESYAPNFDLGEKFLGYERGKEKFRRPDGTWVVDDLKVSYYAYVPEDPSNKWPVEVDLSAPFLELGTLMQDIGKEVMKTIGLIGPETGIDPEGLTQIGRMLHYRKDVNTAPDNPFWCGAHFDHSLFTVLIPAFYFREGKEVEEPMEAGLFVKASKEFKKVLGADNEVMLFQVGEFGQLASHDAICATEHRVQKADSEVERYAMAVFFNPAMDTVIRSQSRLTQDSRYAGSVGDPCTYQQWHEASFNRYIVK